MLHFSLEGHLLQKIQEKFSTFSELSSRSRMGQVTWRKNSELVGLWERIKILSNARTPHRLYVKDVSFGIGIFEEIISYLLLFCTPSDRTGMCFANSSRKCKRYCKIEFVEILEHCQSHPLKWW